jgi:hypothetical protein
MKSRWAVLVLLQLSGLGCGGPDAATSSNKRCGTCFAQEACVANTCVLRTSVPLAWAAEITPLSDSAVAAVTEISPPIGATLSADSLTAVTTTFTFDAPKTPVRNAFVAITMASSIRGRPDLTFQASTNVKDDPLTAKVLVPTARAGRGTAVITMTPLSPDDRASPPRTFTGSLSPSLSFRIAANDDVPLPGRLVDAIGDALSTPFVAKAFQDGAVVSNVAAVKVPDPDMPSPSDGTFTINIPAITAGRPVLVGILPQNPNDPHPYFLSMPLLPANSRTYANLDVALPPYISVPAQFSLDVRGDGPDQRAVAGALVRALTRLVPAEDIGTGTTTFLRDAITDEHGRTLLSLLQGRAMSLLEYELAVIPPGNSQYASLCQTILVSNGGSANSPATLQTKPLPRRFKFDGRVLDSAGAPVRGVVVTSAPGSAPPQTCTTGRSPASEVVTLEDGSFTSYLDPGTYQFDYDPPARSPIPRLTEMEVAVDADVTRDVRLPAARVIEGHVRAADGVTSLANATVRFFEPRCQEADCSGPNRKAPWLRGIGQTDEDGAFRIVVPQPAAN